jgi:hypothetical protein
MNKWTVTSLAVLGIGIAAMLFAQQAGSCVLADDTGSCTWNGTMIFGLGGGILVLLGVTWFLASTWPGPVIRNGFGRFLAIWGIVAITGSAWAYFMLLDWHLGPYCDVPDNCTSWPDMPPAIALFTVIGFAAASAATAVIAASGWSHETADVTP